MSEVNELAIRRALQQVIEPELGKDLVALHMVKSVGIEGGSVRLGVELMTPAYLHRATLEQRALEAMRAVAGVTDARVDFSAVVQSRGARMDQNRMPGVKNIIAIAAGKGGVGKSTVAVNLALALQRHGATVGLLDADVYGPSLPTMLGPAEKAAGVSTTERITPAIHLGLKVMSIGFFVDRDSAVIWRGPMANKLLEQFTGDVDWGDLDYLVVDLPPGTGDVQISLTQMIPITGAVMVTTPQQVAILDVVRAASLFRKVEIPLLGVVENMSYFACPSCGHHEEIFSRGGGKKLAEELGAPFLGELPIEPAVRAGGDDGHPIILGRPDGEHARLFMEIAARVATRLAAIVHGGPRRPAGLNQIK